MTRAGLAARVRAVTHKPASDTAASALASTWALLAATLREGWAREVGKAMAIVTTVPVPTLNGVWATCPNTPPEDIEAGWRQWPPAAFRTVWRRGLGAVPPQRRLPSVAASSPSRISR